MFDSALRLRLGLLWGTRRGIADPCAANAGDTEHVGLQARLRAPAAPRPARESSAAPAPARPSHSEHKLCPAVDMHQQAAPGRIHPALQPNQLPPAPWCACCISPEICMRVRHAGSIGTARTGLDTFARAPAGCAVLTGRSSPPDCRKGRPGEPALRLQVSCVCVVDGRDQAIMQFTNARIELMQFARGHAGSPRQVRADATG